MSTMSKKVLKILLLHYILFKRSEVYTSSKWYCMEAVLEAQPHILPVYFYKNNTDDSMSFGIFSLKHISIMSLN